MMCVASVRELHAVLLTLAHSVLVQNFNYVLNVMRKLGNDEADQISLGDWMSLAGLPCPRDESEVLNLFYPFMSESSSKARATRRPGFLMALSDEDYRLAHDFVVGSPEATFEDLSQLTKNWRRKGKVISSVMSHVCRWLNYRPSSVGERDNNKPPLRDEFLMVLRPQHGRKASAEALLLEREITRFVWEG
jgi:hypothetical protein